MWFINARWSSPHFFIEVRNYLDETFPRRWIDRGSEVAWPPSSPEYNPLDYYLWGQIKCLIYANSINLREELWDKIQNAANFISGQENVFFNVRKSFMNRIRKA